MLARRGVAISTRRGLPLVMSAGQGALVYVVRSGVLTLNSDLAEDRHVISAVFYPGDLVVTGGCAGLPNERLLAAHGGDVVRVRQAVVDEVLSGAPQLSSAYDRRLETRLMRDEVHSVVTGSLTGDEKIASYLVETAQMLGSPIEGGIDVLLPLSRGEIASYLALNPDTLSRLIRRLDDLQIVEFIGRHRAVIRDWPGLLARTPIAATLTRVYAR